MFGVSVELDINNKIKAIFEDKKLEMNPDHGFEDKVPSKILDKCEPN